MPLDNRELDIKVERQDCKLCDRRDVLCLTFIGNDGYFRERICKQCLEVAADWIIREA